MNGKNKPHEYVYLAFLTEDRKAGESSKRSPQHLTLVPPFADVTPIPDLVKAVREVASETPTFKVKIGREAKFGPAHNLDVLLVEPADVVKMLHYQLMYKLQALDVELPTKFVYESYLPHVTIKPAHTTKLSPGQMLTLDHIAVMHKSQSRRSVLAKENLAENYELG